MENEKRSSTDILEDLESIYAMAIANENFSVALKAKELLGRQVGLFLPQQKKKVSLADLSEEDLERLIREIQTELMLDRAERGE
jgi:hypothetical protein